MNSIYFSRIILTDNTYNILLFVHTAKTNETFFNLEDILMCNCIVKRFSFDYFLRVHVVTNST